jgi:hypothetical protein
LLERNSDAGHRLTRMSDADMTTRLADHVLNTSHNTRSRVIVSTVLRPLPYRSHPSHQPAAPIPIRAPLLSNESNRFLT